MCKKVVLSFVIQLVMVFCVFSQEKDASGKYKFQLLGSLLPTPNEYRAASGAPGYKYWQNKADYKINVKLDDEKQTMTGSETITFYNNSPDDLNYLWIQLDQNIFAPNSVSNAIKTNSFGENKNLTEKDFDYLDNKFEGGYRLTSITSSDGKKLNYTIVGTNMRIDLPNTLKSKTNISFNISWWNPINDRFKVGGRSGYEYFPDEDNYLYTIAQFYPRMCVYNDYDGWQNKQYIGAAEFTLAFGDFDVSITVPDDHLVAATGTLTNEKQVLTPKQIEKLNEARKSYLTPVVISNQKEAEEKEKTKSKKYKTWSFSAKNVRDFAFASSRKFIWDAMAVKLPDGGNTMAMSMYPKEGNPLWEKYSTKVVAHTLKSYSKYTFDYPYPVAWSIHSNQIGMEYPMICFNGGRPEKDGSYSERTKYGMISVIIHEVGHNFFPMIINSDERQWGWQDEGFNQFIEYLAEQSFERNYPSGRGPSSGITKYMKSKPDQLEPIMTNPESISQLGNNAYHKVVAGLNMLRETVLGREQFDYAFKTYANRWKFKQPTPADFFRTMKDASGVDLDWFWRGWFFTTEFNDQEIANVSIFTNSDKYKKDAAPESISSTRHKAAPEKTYEEMDTSLVDKYSQKLKTDKEKVQSNPDGKFYYEVTVKNNGELVMPVIMKFSFSDNTDSIVRIPVDIWRKNTEEFKKVFSFSKEVKSIMLDPFLETADTDVTNNTYPGKISEAKKDN